MARRAVSPRHGLITGLGPVGVPIFTAAGKLLANSMLQMGAPIIRFCALRAWHGQVGPAVRSCSARRRAGSGPAPVRQGFANIGATLWQWRRC